MSKSSFSLITHQLQRVPSQAKVAGRSIKGLHRQTLKLTKHRPGRALLGALAVGFVVSRLVRAAFV
jgi:hypothetical protein